MKRSFFILCASLVSLAFFAPAMNPIPASAAEKKEWTIPEDAKWFVGVLEGEIVSKDAEAPGVVFKVKRVVKTGEGNKAKKPDALKGESAVILTQPIFKEGRIMADEKLHAFVKGVKIGAKLELTVKSDGLARLRMTDVPKSIAKK